MSRVMQEEPEAAVHRGDLFWNLTLRLRDKHRKGPSLVARLFDVLRGNEPGARVQAYLVRKGTEVVSLRAVGTTGAAEKERRGIDLALCFRVCSVLAQGDGGVCRKTGCVNGSIRLSDVRHVDGGDV